MVDLKKGESFTFLGFEYRRILTFQGKWRPNYAPKLKKRTALYESLRKVFQQYVSWPVEKVITKINPILRGWVNYFRVGHSSRCFSMVKQWVDKKIRRHLMRARERKGFGWMRWSSDWFYDALGLFNDYGLVRWPVDKSGPSTIGPITLGTKQTGAPSAGNPHAGCDVAGAGDGFTVRLVRHSQRKRGANR
jgi:RNA-directed DNA polymerase